MLFKAEQLEKLIDEKIQDEDYKYLFIDEIQNVEGFEEVINAYREEGIPIRRETLRTYIEILENAKIIYKCPRFDLCSKKSLRGEEKYYLADLSIYYSRNTDTRINYGSVLENIMYTYLRAKGYAMSVGRIGTLECDFITRKRDIYQYIQVAMTIMDKATEDREYRPFLKIKDNYPKYLFTLDQLLQKRDGIEHCNMLEFISQDKEL